MTRKSLFIAQLIQKVWISCKLGFRNKSKLLDLFRHTSLSLLYEAGWEPELLRKRAGHKNIYTTMNTYVHPSDEMVAEEFRKTKPAISAAIACGRGVHDDE